jgi:hypothetical protein
MIRCSSNTEYLQIIITVWDFLNWKFRHGLVEVALLFCLLVPLCFCFWGYEGCCYVLPLPTTLPVMLRWCLPCLQMCGLNLNSDMCAKLVPVYVLQFSWQENSVKSSLADSHISYFEHANVSGTNFVPVLKVWYHKDGDSFIVWNVVIELSDVVVSLWDDLIVVWMFVLNTCKLLSAGLWNLII